MKSTIVENPLALPDGAYLIRNFITHEEEKQLINQLDHVDASMWSRAVRRRQVFFGVRYFHSKPDRESIQPADDPSDGALPLNELQWVIDRVEQNPIFQSVYHVSSSSSGLVVGFFSFRYFFRN